MALTLQFADLITFAYVALMFPTPVVASAEWNPLMSRTLLAVGLPGVAALKLALVFIMFRLASRLGRRAPAFLVIATIGLIGVSGNLAAL